jgi:hypothetical protein
MAEDQVGVTLTHDEALVLSDWLYRRMHTPAFAAAVDDRAVWPALWRIFGTLNGALVEIFDPTYHELLAHARERLIGGMGDFGAEETGAEEDEENG